jgi:hypothetical protein
MKHKILATPNRTGIYAEKYSTMQALKIRVFQKKSAKKDNRFS